MRYSTLLAIFVFIISDNIKAQDFSNKGKDFWVGYGYHVRMKQAANGGSVNDQDMKLYFATDGPTNITVTIPGIGWTRTYSTTSTTPNIIISDLIPKSTATGGDVRLLDESQSPEQKGIHITSDREIVAYAHIYNSSVSGATILFPTNTLGKEYYSINYKNVSNEQDSNPWFYVIATDTGTTTVQIIVSANTMFHQAGDTIIVNLQQGQVYNIMGALLGATSNTTFVDLTGSKVKSIASGTGTCKRIAVFSGSGKISITCGSTTGGNSADNYMVQCFPKDAWGKKYLTVPTKSLNNNIYRICVQDPATLVTVNSLPISVPLTNNFYYELAQTALPQKIEANQPITVAQYITTQGACGNPSSNTNPGDPEVIYLSPVEQNISKVIWNATPNFQITQHYYNVVIPNRGTAITSFKLDGITVASSNFVVHPQDPNFSYLSMQLSGPNVHTIESDSGFNAIAYGFGSAESYGYNAGTNIKDLYNFLQPLNPLNLTNVPNACTGSPFYYTVTFPFQVTSIKWDFNNNPYQTPNSVVTVNNPVYDSTYQIGGRQVWRYKLLTPYTITQANFNPGYLVTLTLGTTSSEGCGNSVERDFNIFVNDPPAAKIGIVHNGCISDSVQFKDSTTYQTGVYSYRWYWDFGDGTKDSVRNPTHKYLTADTFTVKFAMVSNQGCLSDTIIRTIIVNPKPAASFTIASGPYCKDRNILITNTSTISSGNITNWSWNMGDGNIYNYNNGNSFNHSFDTGSYKIKLALTSDKGCLSDTAFNTIVVRPTPLAAFINPQLCLFDVSAYFTDTSKGYGSVINSWQWNFDDPASGSLNTSNLQNPQHDYGTLGVKNAELIVTTNYGCKDTALQTFYVNGGFPIPRVKLFNTGVICANNTISIKDSSTVTPGNVIKIEIYWDTVTAPNVFETDNAPTVGKVYNHNYALFNFPATKIYHVKYRTYSGTICYNDTYLDITINAMPLLQFNVIRDTCLYIDSFRITQASEINGLSGSYVYSGIGVSPSGYINPAIIGVGIDTIKYTYTTTAGCVDSIKQSIKILSPPKANFGFTQPNCAGSNVTFTDSSTSSVGNIANWIWDFGDGSPIVTATNNNAVNHSYTNWGYYDVKLTVTNTSGCNSLICTKRLKVSPYPVVDFTFSDTACLPNATVYFRDNSTIADTTQIGFTYLWSFGENPTLASDTSRVKNPNHTYSNLGPFTVNLTVTSSVGCKTTTPKIINGIYPRPDADFDFDKPSICVGEDITLLDRSNPVSGTIDEWHWTFGDGGISAIQNPNHIYAAAGTPQARLYIVNSYGCISDTAFKPINVYSYPLVSAGPDLPVFEGDFVVLQASAQGSSMQYLWTDSIYLNNPNILNPSCSLPGDVKEQIFRLTVTGIGGCSAYDEVRIFLLKKLNISNFFTPNGDGINDKWEIKNLEYYPTSRVQIFARNGQMVYETKGYSKPWDGTLKGKPLPFDTYYYIIEPGISVLQPMKGYVTIIK